MNTPAVMTTPTCRPRGGVVDERLATSLLELKTLLDQPWSEEATGGLELELWNLHPKTGLPVAWNPKALNLPGLTSELHLGNGELGLTAVNLRRCKDPFSAQLREAHRLQEHLARHGIQAVYIGSPPTLRTSDTDPAYMADVPRYRQIDTSISEGRIYNEDDPRVVRFPQACNGSIMPEASCTSMQLNWQVTPESFHNARDASLVIAGLMVALGANEPYMWGELREDGGRIPVFELVTNDRAYFGNDWSPDFFGYFEDVMNWPVIADLPSDNEIAKNSLKPLTDHNSTVWGWHRAKIIRRLNELIAILECRETSAQPTFLDNLALMAFQAGLIAYFTPRMEAWRQNVPFSHSKGNFYAGTIGMEARLQWPNTGQRSRTRTISAKALTMQLLPHARAGLKMVGVPEHEIEYLLGIIKRRAELGVNGAVWQRRAYGSNLRTQRDTHRAAKLTLQQYRTYAQEGRGKPVHTWPLPN
jgi:hypothetical protein